jgi:hypothetical protein
MSHLSESEIHAAREWASGVFGCTCQTEYDGNRYVVTRHTCPACQTWNRKLSDAGVNSEPKPLPQRASYRRKWRRAA